MVGTAAFVGLSVLLCLADTTVSLLSKCRVSSFKVISSFSNSCDIQFGYMTTPPDWIDQLDVVQSFKNASEEQLDAFAKDVCRCRMLRVHRHCPNDLFELIKGVSWRCFPGAREAVKKNIADTIMRQRQQDSKDGSDDGGIESQDSTQEEESQSGKEAEVENSHTEGIPTIASDVEDTTTEESIGLKNETNGSGDIISVESGVYEIGEFVEENFSNNSEESSGSLTETTIGTETMDQESSRESFESVTVDSFYESSGDDSEGSAIAADDEGSGHEIIDVAMDTGNGGEKGSTEGFDGSSGKEIFEDTTIRV